MELDSFVFKKKWIEKIAALPMEQQDQILAEIVRYGTGSELKYKDNAVINSMVKLITDEIDFSKEKYRFYVLLFREKIQLKLQNYQG